MVFFVHTKELKGEEKEKMKPMILLIRHNTEFFEIVLSKVNRNVIYMCITFIKR